MTALVLLRAVGGDTVPLINYWTQPTPILHVVRSKVTLDYSELSLMCVHSLLK